MITNKLRWYFISLLVVLWLLTYIFSCLGSAPSPPNPPRYACVDYNPCNNGGTCYLNSTESTTTSTAIAQSSQPDYYCLCRDGTWGDHCQYSKYPMDWYINCCLDFKICIFQYLSVPHTQVKHLNAGEYKNNGPFM